MDYTTIAFAVCAALSVSCFFLWTAWKKAVSRNSALESLNRELELSKASHDSKLQVLSADLENMQIATEKAAIARDAAIAAQHQSEKQLELLRQKILDMESRMQDWETVRQESMSAAKAAMMETSNLISSKLLEDHKREAEAVRKQSEETFKQNNTAVMQQFEGVAKTVATLNTQVQESRQMASTVWKALSSPLEAGRHAEIGLENCLKSFGLEPGRDFIMQYHLPSSGESTAARLRPDAVIFLPANRVMIIDSKASKFLLETGSAQSQEEESAALENLKKSMNEHMRKLAQKDYQSNLVEYLGKERKHERGGLQVLTVMYMPSDTSVERLLRADHTFAVRAADADIIAVGPAGLAGLIAFARLQIGMERQVENQEKIIEKTGKLLESIGSALTHAEKAGKGIKSAADGFSAFASSVNKFMIPRAMEISRMSAKNSSSRKIPAQLTNYQVAAFGSTISLEAEEIEDSPDNPEIAKIMESEGV